MRHHLLDPHLRDACGSCRRYGRHVCRRNRRQGPENPPQQWLRYFVEVTAQHGRQADEPPLNANSVSPEPGAGQPLTTAEPARSKPLLRNAGTARWGWSWKASARLSSMVTAAIDDLRAEPMPSRCWRRSFLSKLAGRRQLCSAPGRGRAWLCHRRRPASGGRTVAERDGQPVCNALDSRPDQDKLQAHPADHRPQQGRQSTFLRHKR